MNVSPVFPLICIYKIVLNSQNSMSCMVPKSLAPVRLSTIFSPLYNTIFIIFILKIYIFQLLWQATHLTPQNYFYLHKIIKYKYIDTKDTPTRVNLLVDKEKKFIFAYRDYLNFIIDILRNEIKNEKKMEEVF